MAMLDDRLSQLMHQKAHYLNKRAEVLTENITNSEMRNARRKELASFASLIKKAPHAQDSKGRQYSDVKLLKISEKDIIVTKDEISREMEMLKLTKGTTDHDGLLNVIKAFHRMYHTILAK